MRPHLLIVPLAIAMALLIELPLLLFPWLAGAQYQGINIAHFGTDQHFYLARAKDVLDGHKLGNSFLREGKDGQDTYFTWNERVLLAPFQWVGIAEKVNIVTVYTVMNGIGVALLIVLIYAFVYQLSRDRLLSIASALFVVGGYSVVLYRTFFYEDMNLYGRAMTPYLSSIGLFTYLNLLLRSLTHPRIRTIVGATVSFGALFYIYLFLWTYASVFTGLLIAFLLLQRQWARAKTVMYIFAGGLLLGAYNLYFLLSTLLFDGDHAVKYFHFMAKSRAPLFSMVGAVLLAMFAAYTWKHRTDERLPIIASVVAAGWVVVNQQIITGLLIQPGHYYWYFIVPMGIIVALFMGWSVLIKTAWKPYICAGMVLFVFVNTTVGQVRAAYKTVPEKLEEQRFAPMLKTLQTDTDPSVILAAGDAHAYLYVIYTKHDLFWHDAATYFHPRLERMKDVLSVYLLLNTDARKDVPAFLRIAAADQSNDPSTYTSEFTAIEGYTSGWTFPDYLAKRAVNDPELLKHRERLIAELDGMVRALSSDSSALRELLMRYGVGYVAWDKKEYPNWDVSVLGSLQELQTANDLTLYRYSLTSSH